MTDKERDELLLQMQKDDKKRDELLLEINAHLSKHDEQFEEINTHLSKHDEQFEEMNAHLSKHDEQFEEINAHLSKHDEQFEEINAHLSKHDKQLKDHDEKFEEMTDIMIDMQSNIGTLNREVTELKKTVNSLSGSVAIMEKDHGDKLQILLDMVGTPAKEVYSMRDEVDSHEARLFEHDMRISSLEKKVSNA